ncbi:MAG: biopolymer transporter ExbD [Bdellovibrionaceae bacterium]|nr:biopolymer transporter ExbD [Pseudobdellovibrionaceae bacterium]
MRRAVDKLLANNKKSTFVLQLTAMVDMFTILIVFLLKSFSTSAVTIDPHKNLILPTSTAYVEPIEALKIVVSLDGIYVDDKKIVQILDGKIIIAELDTNDQDFVRTLFDELEKQATKSKNIANNNEDVAFEGKLVMQADSRIDYGELKKVMYTASLAGYADLKLATMAYE